MVTSFPLVSFFITLLFVCTHGEIVLDTYDRQILFGQKYFIKPCNNEGGLEPGFGPLCPLDITQSLFSSGPGLPVGLTDLSGFSFIQTSTHLKIEFKSDYWPLCNKFSKVWAVDVSSSAAKEPAIIIGGEPGQRNTWFKIEKADKRLNIYKLTALDKTVGLTPTDWFGDPKLILTDDDAKTVLVKFEKAYDVTTTTTSTSKVEKLGLRMFPF